MSIPLRDYWGLFRRYLIAQRWSAMLMAVFLLAGIGFSLLGPQVVRAFLDALENRAGVGALARLAALFIGISALGQAGGVLAQHWSGRVAWTATNALRADLALHLLRLDPGFFQKRTPGELIERVDGDVAALSGFFSGFAVELAGSVCLLSGVLITLFFVATWLGLACTAFAALAVAGLGRLQGVGAPLFREVREQSARFYGYVGEVLTATEDLHSAGAVPYALGRFFAHLRSWYPVVRRAAVPGNAIWVAALVLFGLGDALAYGLGGGLYVHHAISLGTVYMILAYVGLLARPLETIRTQLQDLQRADAGIARIRELLQTRSALADGERQPPPGPLSVEMRAVRFHYSEADEAALEDVTFTLPPGRTLGLLGRTGSGKSTLARLLFRFYDPWGGQVLLGGLDLRTIRLQALRSRIGLVTQEVQVFEGSLRDNLTLFDTRILDARLLDVLDDLGLRAWVRGLPGGLDTPISSSALSAGEAQLLALARVFLKDPGLVVLDEAGSRLDPATEALLDHTMRRLLRDRTAIVIAHRLATVDRVDDILILEAGRVVEHGPRLALAADPGSRFHRLHRTGIEEVLR